MVQSIPLLGRPAAARMMLDITTVLVAILLCSCAKAENAEADVHLLEPVNMGHWGCEDQRPLECQEASRGGGVETMKACLLGSGIAVNETVEDFLKWYDSQRQVAYTMEVKPVDTPLDRATSKVGGLPFLLPGEGWPTSKVYKEELQLVWQFNIQELPQAAQEVLDRKDGLFQFFLSENILGYEEDDYYLVRVLQPDQLKESGSAQPTTVKVLHEKAVVGWKEVLDWPQAEDAIQMYTGSSSFGSPLWKLFHVLRDVASCVWNQKLLGWPYWTQYPDWGMADASMQEHYGRTLALPLSARYKQFLQYADVGDGSLLIQVHPTEKADSKFYVSWATS